MPLTKANDLFFVKRYNRLTYVPYLVLSPSLYYFPSLTNSKLQPISHPCHVFARTPHATTFQSLITLHTKTMAETAAMVWSGTSAGITKCRRRCPQWTDMTSWREGISAKAPRAFVLGVAYPKWPLFCNQCNNCTAPLMNRGPFGHIHSSITTLFDRSDDGTIIDELVSF